MINLYYFLSSLYIAISGRKFSPTALCEDSTAPWLLCSHSGNRKFYSHFKSDNIVSLEKCKASKVQDTKQSFSLYAEGSLPLCLSSLCQATCLLTHLLLTSRVPGNKRRSIKGRNGSYLAGCSKSALWLSALLGRTRVESRLTPSFWTHQCALHKPSPALPGRSFCTIEGVFPLSHPSLFLLGFCFPGHPHQRTLGIPSPCGRRLFDSIQNNFNVIKSPSSMQKL